MKEQRGWINEREGKEVGVLAVSAPSRALLLILASVVILDCGLSSVGLLTDWAKKQ